MSTDTSGERRVGKPVAYWVIALGIFSISFITSFALHRFSIDSRMISSWLVAGTFGTIAFCAGVAIRRRRGK
jgi:hypothetical protein